MCAKCKLKLGEHLLPHQVQVNQAANSIQISKNSHQNSSLNHQCNYFETINDLIHTSGNLIDKLGETDADENLIAKLVK